MQKTALCLFFHFIGVFAFGQVSNFTFSSPSGKFCAPAIIQFTQTSTGSPLGFSWNFGNGQTSSQPNPGIAFANPGVYTVKLTTLYETTLSETTQQVTIYPTINTTLTPDRPYICTPGAINFTTNTSGGTPSGYNWTWGDGNTSSTGTNTATHNYSAFNTYTVTVQPIDANGCANPATTTVKLEKPLITASSSPTSGCIPALVTHTSTVNVPAGTNVTAYNWDYGDGVQLNNSTSSSVTHSYTATGSYTPSLNIVTNEGCTNSITMSTIAFGIPPTNLTAYTTKLQYCGSEDVVGVAHATNANSFRWNFGDGTITDTPDTLISHRYLTLGTHNLTVTPLFNGCAGATQNLSIQIIGVIASFTYSNTCTNKVRFDFLNTTQGNQSTYTWNFGDGSPSVNTLNTSHNYPAIGVFNTTLTVTDNITGCADTYAKDIVTDNPAIVNLQSQLCKGATALFALSGNLAPANTIYTWNALGQPPYVTSAPNHFPPAYQHGNFTNNFVIIDKGVGYCKDTLYLDHSILVRGPVIDFSGPPEVCVDEKFSVTNRSHPFIAGDSVLKWYWNFGNSNLLDSNYQPAPFSYYSPGFFPVSLKAIDINGCQDSVGYTITVNQIPYLRIFPRADTLCAGNRDTLFAFHDGNLTWIPAGSVSCSTCDTTFIQPNMNTIFRAQVVNAAGCMSKDSSIITVYTPFNATAIKSPIQVCKGEPVSINVQPSGRVISWSPAANLSTPNGYNPTVISPRTETYVATLTDSAGCFTSTVNVDVILKASPVVNAGPDQVLPFNAPFTISPVYSSNVRSYLWEPSTGLNCTTCRVVNGMADDSRKFTITVTSDSGCVARDSINIVIECKRSNLYMPTAFTPNGDNLNDYFYPLTRGITSIKHFTIYNRLGQKVFERSDFMPNDKTSGWDGKFRGTPQTQESYVWVLEALCDAGQVVTAKGSFTLIR
ncbi:MAG: PKD domain-containing protein [Ferruginibacter sp.]